MKDDMTEDDPIIIASTENDPTDSLDFLGDIGNIEIPEVNLDFFDFDPEEEADTENRYVKPKLVPMKTDQVLYDNAAKLARELKIEAGSRYDCIVSGSFIFGDFIGAFMVLHQAARHDRQRLLLQPRAIPADTLHVPRARHRQSVSAVGGLRPH